jgi:ribosomal protein S18 acetylase RimI-like enzyme
MLLALDIRSNRRSEPRAPGVVIREMASADISAVIDLMRSLPDTAFLEWEDIELLQAHLARGAAANFVAVRSDGHIVGAVIAGSVGVRGTISHVAVGEPHRRNGIADTLVGHVLASLRASGIKRVFLFTGRGNYPAQRLWAHCGFAEMGLDSTWELDL